MSCDGGQAAARKSVTHTEGGLVLCDKERHTEKDRSTVFVRVASLITYLMSGSAAAELGRELCMHA